MPQALLYQGFGLHGYDYQKTEYKDGQVFFYVVRSRRRLGVADPRRHYTHQAVTRPGNTLPPRPPKARAAPPAQPAVVHRLCP